MGNPRTRALILIAIQLAVVCSVAAKYRYERAVFPRVWVQTSSIDPNLFVRGRYLWLPVEVNACGLKPQGDFSWPIPPNRGRNKTWSASLAVRDGQMIALQKPHVSGYQTVRVAQNFNQSCEQARLQEGIPFFVPDTASSPLPLKGGQELWAEVTVPPAGPPRAIRLAVKQVGKLTPLNLR